MRPARRRHFVYVVVSDGRGGYSQGRILINTDAIGAPTFIAPATVYAAPAQAAPTGVPVRFFFGDFPPVQVTPTFPVMVNAPGIPVSLEVRVLRNGHLGCGLVTARAHGLPLAMHDARSENHYWSRFGKSF
jgi:hypothetical protein